MRWCSSKFGNLSENFILTSICHDAQVSVGTLLAFTMVAISILILRYIPPGEVPLPSSLHESINSVSLRYGTQEIDTGSDKGSVPENKENSQHSLDVDPSPECPLIAKEDVQGELKRI